MMWCNMIREELAGNSLFVSVVDGLVYRELDVSSHYEEHIICQHDNELCFLDSHRGC